MTAESELENNFIKVLKASLCWKLLSRQNPNTNDSVQIPRCFSQ